MTLTMILIGYFSIGFNLWLAITIISAARLQYSWSEFLQTLKENQNKNIIFIGGWVFVLLHLLMKKVDRDPQIK